MTDNQNTSSLDDSEPKGPLRIKNPDGSLRKPSWLEFLYHCLKIKCPTEAHYLADYATNTFFRAGLDQYNLHRICLIKLSHEPLLSQEDPEFEKQQLEWWSHYSKMIILRELLIPYFQLMYPDWRELLPDREDFGVIWSEEDWEKISKNPPPGCGITMNKAESMDDYKPMRVRFEDEERPLTPSDGVNEHEIEDYN